MNTTPDNKSTNDPEDHSGNANGPPSPFGILALIVNWLRHYWDAPREKPKWTDVAGVILALIVAIAAICSAWIFQGQLTEARKSRELMETQWKNQQVPWLGLEDNAIKVSPILEFAWSPVLAYPSIWVTVAYSIKNFGPAPAFHAFDSVHAIAYREGFKPTTQLEVLCQMREGIGKGHAETSDGEVILPGGYKKSTWSTGIQLNPGQTHLERLWLIVCVSYEDSWKRVHHSRYMYMSGPGSGPTTTPYPDHPDWTYIKIGGAYLDGAQAD